MKKIFFSVLAMYLNILVVFSQKTTTDTAYHKRHLTFEEANMVSSYYSQNGDHGAVTGGIGTEKLSDISNSIDLKFSKYNKHGLKHTFTGEIGIDYYTSASSDNIDPHTISSPSHADTRIYPSLGWTMENGIKRYTVGAGISYSREYDYQSFGGNINFSKKSKNGMSEFSAKLQAFSDQVSLIYPIELRTNGRKNDYATTPRNSYNADISWSQIINQRFQIAFNAGAIYQSGYLGLPFHRVYFNDQSVHVEKLPSSRFKVPLGVRANYFFGDNFILRSWYRFYKDDWGILSNTLQVETVVKITPFISVSPFYRYYQQTASKYFEPYQMHTADDQYFTSNYDLSKFNSNFFGAGIRMAPPEGVFKIQHLAAIELRYGHYQKTTGMHADIISLNLTVK